MLSSKSNILNASTTNAFQSNPAISTTLWDPPRSPLTPLPPSGIKPVPEKKEYCTHWIKTGECSFMAVGCKYKHEIPPLAKLRELGFFSVPRWYKERAALQISSTWLQRRAEARREGAELEPPPQEVNPYLSKWKPKVQDESKDEEKEDSGNEASGEESDPQPEDRVDANTPSPTLLSPSVAGQQSSPPPPPTRATTPESLATITPLKARPSISRTPIVKPVQPTAESQVNSISNSLIEALEDIPQRSKPRSFTKGFPRPIPLSAPAALPPTKSPGGLVQSRYANDDMETKWLRKIAKMPPPLVLPDREEPQRVDPRSRTVHMQRPRQHGGRRNGGTGKSRERSRSTRVRERSGAQNEVLITL